jgi:protein SCO1
MKTHQILITFFVVLAVGFLSAWKYYYNQHPRTLPVLGQEGHRVGAFSFTNQDGKTITDADMKGKICVAEYFFTTCKSICPVMNDNMVAVYTQFRNDKNFAILSHTVDPETDTVAQMKNYSLKFDADVNKWMFLTGAKEPLYKMALNDYLVSVVDSTKPNEIPNFIHTEKFVLVDPDKRIRGFYDGTNKTAVQQLIGDIKSLKKEYKY